MVLILVLVEDGLGDLIRWVYSEEDEDGLNPCFSGGWSRRMAEYFSESSDELS